MIYYFKLSIEGTRTMHEMLKRLVTTDINKLKTFNVGAVACNEILKSIVNRINTRIENSVKKEVKVKLRYYEMRVLVEVLMVSPHYSDYELAIKRSVLLELHPHATILNA